ncbi:MAG: hypothetical protein WD426_16585 [Anditalea sp.]
MEINKIVQTLRKEGRIYIKEGQGKIIELIVPERWKAHLDRQDGVFLIFDLFQIRNIALPFSEVSLDIVELASKPIIYHTTANEALKNAPVSDHVVRFSLIKEGFWNQLLFNYGRPLIYQVPDLQGEVENTVNKKFPLMAGGVKEMFLGPEGEVKILNG